jgi:hypothetical protein
MRDNILRAAEEQAREGQLACARAMAIAAELGVAPREVGQAVNRASDLRFYRCQLGLFGYGPKDLGQHKVVQPAAHVPDALRQALLARAHDGRIACLDVWQVAEAFEYPRLAASCAVEALGLKVSPCQLGCF